jgi:hypothetical protein
VLIVDAVPGTAERVRVYLAPPVRPAVRTIVQGLLGAKAQPDGSVLVGVLALPILEAELKRVVPDEVIEYQPGAAKVYQEYQRETRFLLQNKAEKPPFDYLLGVPGLRTTPYLDQTQCVAFHARNPDGRSIEMGETGVGKAQPKTTPVLTPAGWRPIGELVVGDPIIGADGKTHHVTAVYPQGGLPVFRVEFSDGAATVCSEEHLWETQSRLERVDTLRGRPKHTVRTLNEIRATPLRVHYGNQRYWNYSIPITEPVEFAERELSLHPYVMGALLGDGSLHHGPSFTSADPELVDRFSRLLPDRVKVIPRGKYGYYLTGDSAATGEGTGWFNGRNYNSNPVTAALRQYNLRCHSRYKFIPTDYLLGSVAQRLALLQGLMDTDGWVQGASILFSSISASLVRDVRSLVQSLGGITSCVRAQKKRCQTGATVWAYTITIRLPTTMIPFTLQRKLDRLPTERKYLPIRFITRIDPIGDADCVCITTSAADQLYLTDEHIVTHNSLTILYTYAVHRMKQAKKALLLVLNTGKIDWEKEIRLHTTFRPYVVGNGTSTVLADIMAFGKGNADILVMHYDAIIHGEGAIVRALSKLPIGMVMLDEVHVLKSPTSLRHKSVMQIIHAYGPDVKIVPASGTAMDGNPKSAWAPLKIVAGDRYFPTYSEFTRFFVTTTLRKFGHRYVNVETGFRNLRYLKMLLDPVSIRFLKADVVGRPSKIFQPRLVTLAGPQLKLYNTIKEAIYQEVVSAEGDTIPLAGLATRILRLRQVLNHPKLIEGVQHYEGDSAKYEELDSITEEVLSNPEAQILVWTQWRAAVERLVARYKQYGAIAFYGGSDTHHVRDQLLSKRARVCVAIPEKAGTSVDFLKVCRTAVFLEKPYSLSLYRQSLDRIDRRSNTDAALILTIEAVHSVDQLVNHILERKSAVFDAVTLDDEKLITLGKADVLRYLK